MTKYILHYFPLNGRGLVPRAILSYKKAEWTNDLIKFEEWPSIKKSGLCEYEQVPILEIGDKKYSQSYAIVLYLAETFNLMGKNPEENYQITNLLMSLEDFLAPINKILYGEKDDNKEELLKKAGEKVKFFAQKFEKKYVELGKGKYFLGDKITLADIILGTGITEAINRGGIKDFNWKEIAPNLEQLIKRVQENELKEFFEKYYFK